MKIDELAVELLGLPARSRAILAEKLLASLEEERDEDVDALWLELAERRAHEVREGKVTPVPAAEVMRAAREKLRG